jgi:hypothetical protein
MYLIRHPPAVVGSLSTRVPVLNIEFGALLLFRISDFLRFS